MCLPTACSCPVARVLSRPPLCVTIRCGTAGGMLPGQGQGGAGASYTDTENAKHGDLGSKLPPLDTVRRTSTFSLATHSLIQI